MHACGCGWAAVSHIMLTAGWPPVTAGDRGRYMVRWCWLRWPRCYIMIPYKGLDRGMTGRTLPMTASWPRTLREYSHSRHVDRGKKNKISCSGGCFCVTHCNSCQNSIAMLVGSPGQGRLLWWLRRGCVTPKHPRQCPGGAWRILTL